MASKNDWKENQLTVALRIRPLTPEEMERGSEIIAHAIEDSVVVLRDPTDDPDDILRAKRSREKHYVFDKAFDESSTQEEVYELTTKCLIESVTQGYNATVFAYGATGAGKTYTMLGTDHEPGIMARALNDLFTEMESKTEEKIFAVSMSYLEIYNEMIRDLLNPTTGYLDLREDASGNVQVAGIKQISTTSTTEIMNLLMQGNKERTQEPTAANKTSSRSHAVLQVTIKERSRVRATVESVRIGKLFMIDLAGSERASQTKNRGKRMIEGAHINRSLLALGNCINALCLGGKYVNYRDSKLTRLLKDSLGGNCRTVMITNISPADYLFEESKNTLLYADRAKKIKLKVKPNQMNVNYHISQYSNIITELKQEIERLKGKIAEHQIDGRKTRSTHTDVENSASQHSREEMDHLRHQLISNFQAQMGIRQQLMAVEQNTWELALEAERYQGILADFEQDKLRQHVPSKLHGINSSLTLELDNREKERALEKDLETDSNGSDSPEPDEVMTARDSLTTAVLARKQKEGERRKLEKKLENVRQAATSLEEVLPKKITSEEQRELLEMLCKVHELEIENTELKSRALMDRHVFEQKEGIIVRYEKHKQVCDHIISEQRKLIAEHGLPVPMELEELYDKYAMGVNEDLYEDIRAHSSMHHNIEGIKAASVLNLRTLKQMQEERDDSNSPEKESVEIKQSRQPPKRQHAHPESKPAATGQPRVFQPSPRTRQLRESGGLGPIPRVTVDSPATPVTKHESLVDLSTHSTRQPLKRPYTPPNGLTAHPVKSFNDLSLSESDTDLNRKEIVQRTKNIAAVAARKRTSQKGTDRAYRPEKLNLHDRTFASMRVLSEASEPRAGQESALTASRLSQLSRTHYVSSPVGSHLSDLDDLASLKSYDLRSQGAADSHHGSSLRKPSQMTRYSRNGFQEKRQKRESNGQTSSYIPRMTGRRGGAVSKVTPRRILPQSTPFSFKGEVSNSSRNYPAVNHAGEQDIATLTVRKDTPPTAVHQIGADRGRGHTLLKRYKGAQPTGVMQHPDSSASSTPIPAAGSKQPSRGVKPVAIPSQVRRASLTVSGLAVPRKNITVGRKL